MSKKKKKQNKKNKKKKVKLYNKKTRGVGGPWV